MNRKTTSLHDWATDSVGSGLWSQPAGTRRVTSTTYERAMKRRFSQIRTASTDFHDSITKKNQAENKKEEQIFTAIANRYWKKHPELSKFKAYYLSTTKDPLARKFYRLSEQGYGADYIAKKLGYKNGKFKASSGHSGG